MLQESGEKCLHYVGSETDEPIQFSKSKNVAKGFLKNFFGL